MNKTSTRALARFALIFLAMMAGILNGSVLAAPVLIFMVYLLAVLVRQGQTAMSLYWSERTRMAVTR